MKRKILSVVLSLAVMLAMVPAVSYAADTRTVVDSVTITGFNEPSYGDSVADSLYRISENAKYPKGAPYHVEPIMSDVLKYVDGAWIYVSRDYDLYAEDYMKTYAEGKYRYEVQVRIDEPEALKYRFDDLDSPEFKSCRINGKACESFIALVDEDYSYAYVYYEFEVKKGISIKTKKPALSKSEYAYTGKAQKPAVKVSGLKSGTDYTVSYKNNVKVGTATAIIKGKGRYSGTVTKTFNIVPKKAAVSKLSPGKKKLTVKMTAKPSSKAGSTYQIGYKKKGTSTWKYTTTTSGSKTIKSLKKGKTYYVKVRAYKTVNKVKYYGEWSKTKLSKKIR